MKILVTGAAGFIGMHVCIKLLKNNFTVFGIDNLNSYYSVELKKKRILEIEKLKKNFVFKKIDLLHKVKLKKIIEKEKFEVIINLAAQAGVRFSIKEPKAYLDSNVNGFLNLLENSKDLGLKHLIFASSSSVYGLNKDTSYSETSITDNPISMYAVTKKSNELMAFTYSHLYDIPSTGVRFFTVYGPWGRPDMALSIFTKSILNKKPIFLHNNGNMLRDFTFVDDIVESVLRLVKKPPVVEHNNIKGPPFRILNIGNGSSIPLKKYIECIEKAVGVKAIIEFKSHQMGEVISTLADTKELEALINFKPNVSVEKGIKSFVSWYKSYHKITN